MNNSTITIEQQIEYLEAELKLLGQQFKHEIETGKSNREDCLLKYRVFQAVISTIKIAAGGDIRTFIRELSELPNDAAQLKLTLATVMQENARLIREVQGKQNLINVLNKFYNQQHEDNYNKQLEEQQKLASQNSTVNSKNSVPG